jgi:hypothetical protein
VALDRLAQLRGIDTDLAGELVHRLRPRDVTAVDEFCGIAVPRINDAKTIFPEKSLHRKSTRPEWLGVVRWLSNIASTTS